MVVCVFSCVYYCSTTGNYKLSVRVGEGDSGGHVSRETTSRGLSWDPKDQLGIFLFPSEKNLQVPPGLLKMISVIRQNPWDNVQKS